MWETWNNTQSSFKNWSTFALACTTLPLTPLSFVGTTSHVYLFSWNVACRTVEGQAYTSNGFINECQYYVGAQEPLARLLLQKGWWIVALRNSKEVKQLVDKQTRQQFYRFVPMSIDSMGILWMHLLNTSLLVVMIWYRERRAERRVGNIYVGHITMTRLGWTAYQ